MIEDYEIEVEIKARKDAAEGTVRCPLSDVAPSTIATNVAPVRKDFIPPSSIGVSQEATDARTYTETLTQKQDLLMMVLSHLQSLQWLRWVIQKKTLHPQQAKNTAWF